MMMTLIMQVTQTEQLAEAALALALAEKARLEQGASDALRVNLRERKALEAAMTHVDARQSLFVHRHALVIWEKTLQL